MLKMMNKKMVAAVVLGLAFSFGAALVDICLIMFLGSALGIGFGVFFGSVFKKENARVMMPLAFSMVCSFMSGLMVGFMKQVVEDPEFTSEQ